MSLTLFDDGPFLTISRYLKRKNGVFWFDRRVPKDVQPHVGCERIRKSLSTKDGREAHRRLAAINAKHEAQWQALRSGAVQPTAQEPERPFQGGTAFQPTVDEKTQPRSGASLPVPWPGPSRNAVDSSQPATLHRPVVRFLDALDLYLRNHEKGSQPAFLKTIFPARDYLLQTIGNIPLATITRQHANRIRDTVLQAGRKTATARRRIDTLSAIFVCANREHGLKLDNPFAELQIAKEGLDAEKRDSFTEGELREIAEQCHKLNNDIRHIVALQLDTGARLGEIVGLRVADVVLNAEVPFIHIRPDTEAGRSLKTEASERRVPLVGEALWAAKEAVARASGEWLFPRYAQTGNINANSASASINKWLCGFVRGTSHWFRHTMQTRLRACGTPEEILEQIGGWSAGKKVSRGYGSGYPLGVLRQHLQKVLLCERPSRAE